MAVKEDGGPAFPTGDDPNSKLYANYGMTLRDYFAAQALAGIEASQGNSGNFVSTVEKVAARCYDLADAMIAARGAE